MKQTTGAKNRIAKVMKAEKMIKYNTSKAKFRVFKNRFASYILQKKDKTIKSPSGKCTSDVNSFKLKKTVTFIGLSFLLPILAL